MTVAVLCAARKSVYHAMPGVEVFDIDRDAKTFTGNMPAIGHPPCRLWSAFCSHQAKSEDPQSEKELGVWCVDQVRRWGGIIEQPAHSRLWDACGLPKPGWPSTYWSDLGFSIEVSQFWWGDVREKNTWLFIKGVHPLALPDIPFRLKPDGGDRRIWQLMSSKNQRERTPEAFAVWLVECARRVSQ